MNQTQLQKLYGTKLTPEDLARIYQRAERVSKGEVVGIEAEFRNPRSARKLAGIVREMQRQLIHVKNPERIELKFENENTMEINSYPFKLKELPKVLERWSMLEDHGLTSMHLSYSGKPWEILNKIGLTAAVLAPTWRSFWNPNRLDSWSQCWPHIRGNIILPREFGVVSRVSEHRYDPSIEIRYVGKRIEALGKILPFALKNYKRITDEDFETPEPDIPYLGELKNEITRKKRFPHYAGNVALMVTWPFWIPDSSLFKKFLPNTCEYCADNRDELLKMHTSLANSYSKERKYPNIDAGKDVANGVAKRSPVIMEVYEVLHY